MTLPVLAIRPEPGCSATVAAGAAAGLAIELSPLFEIRSVSWTPPQGEFDGLLLGSANALRHGGPHVDNFVGKPAYTVGEMTADEARRRDFAVAGVGEGSLQNLVDGLAGRELRLLRLAARERVPLHPPLGIVVETVTVYDSIAVPLPPGAAQRLGEGAVVLLHSAAAARHLASECDRLSIQRSDIRLAALSPRIAEAAGGGWAALHSAAMPNEAALLALASDMCHDPSGG
jgi:uroporphyrinogen-III synthase